MPEAISTQSRHRYARSLPHAGRLVLVAILLAGGGGCSRAEPEPSFRDSVRQLNEPQKQFEAVRKVFTDFYDGRDPKFVARLVALFDDHDARVREGAAYAIGLLASNNEASKREAEAAKAALVRALGDPDSGVRDAAIGSLSSIGNLSRSEILALAACLKDQEKRVRWDAARVIGVLGYKAADINAAAPALEAALADTDADVRWAAAIAVGHVSSKRENAIPGLIGMLGQRRPGSGRFVPAIVLGQIGPAAKIAVPALRPLLKDADAQTRATAAWTLWRISGDLDQTVPVLVEALGSRRPIIVATGQPPVAGTEPDNDARLLAGEALIEISRAGASSKKVVDAAIKKVPAEAVAEFAKAKSALIDKVEKPLDESSPKK